MTVQFSEFEIVCERGTKATRKAFVIPETDGVLAVQVQETIEGDVFLPLHVPSTAIMSREWGFTDAEEARKALIRFWESLTPEHKKNLKRQQQQYRAKNFDRRMLTLFTEAWTADCRIDEAGRDE
jgi:hypothetical protein